MQNKRIAVRLLRMSACLMLVLFGGTVGAQQTSPSETSSRELFSRGEAIFLGEEPIIARLQGDSAVLPSRLSHCSGCHESSLTGRLDRSAALRLDRSTLLSTKKRRGAIPSAYSRDAFCRVVRTGVDPVFVMVAREMPRYEVDEVQCSSLWSYVTDRSELRAR